MNITDQSLVREFVIVGFSDLNGIHYIMFPLLFSIYLFAVSGNITIITLVYAHNHLHVPLYIFIAMLSFLEIWYTTVTIPKMLASLLNRKTISYNGCLSQIYFLHCLGISGAYLLAAMAYDRYLAICNPLRYSSIMTNVCCLNLAACCWVIGLVGPITQIILLSQLPFCDNNMIEHIFCDFNPVMKLACSDTTLNVMVDFYFFSFLLFPVLSYIVLSYIKIISAVLRINTTEGWRKAFSTCGSHLTVVILFFGSVAFMYVRPTNNYPANFDRSMALIYSVLTPMCNPIIYSLRNREIRELLRKRNHRRVI